MAPIGKRLVVDPITRIEGHLRIEVELDDAGRITDAFSSGTAFRGIELILKDRDPRDLGLFAQRICGVCTYHHYERSTEAVERAYGIKLPPNARRVRNLLLLSQFLQDHLLHFYQLHSLDWWDVTGVLEADPVRAARLSRRYTERPYHGEDDLARARERIAKLVASGQLGPFARGFWGHPRYRFAPEQNLIMAAHYLENLKIQRLAAQMTAILGSKNPHPQSLVVGGVTVANDALRANRLGEYGALLDKVAAFVEQAYLPDIVMLGEVYKGEALAGRGCGPGNYMVFGFVPLDEGFWEEARYYIAPGYILAENPERVLTVDPEKIGEEVSRSWYSYTGDDGQRLHPFKGETRPRYTGFSAGGTIDPAAKYSWIKTPRYDGHAMEVGPLARLLVAYHQGHERMRAVVEGYLRRLGVPLSFFESAVGRTAARALETRLVVEVAREQLAELTRAVAAGDERFFSGYTPKDGEGVSLREVPRGALSHWVRIENGRVANFQAVVPSTWNAAPRGHDGSLGAYETSLRGEVIADPERPLEILRIIHSFDPCMSCAVHLIQPGGAVLGPFRVEA